MTQILMPSTVMQNSMVNFTNINKIYQYFKMYAKFKGKF